MQHKIIAGDLLLSYFCPDTAFLLFLAYWLFHIKNELNYTPDKLLTSYFSRYKCLAFGGIETSFRLARYSIFLLAPGPRPLAPCPLLYAHSRYLTPRYISLPRVGPQTEDVSKYGLNGSCQLIIGCSWRKSKIFSQPPYTSRAPKV